MMKTLTPFSSDWKVVQIPEKLVATEVEACFWEMLGACWFYSPWLEFNPRGQEFCEHVNAVNLSVTNHLGLPRAPLNEMLVNVRNLMVQSVEGVEVEPDTLIERLTQLLGSTDAFGFEFFLGGFERAVMQSYSEMVSSDVRHAVQRLSTLRGQIDYAHVGIDQIRALIIDKTVQIMLQLRSCLQARKVLESCFAKVMQG